MVDEVTIDDARDFIYTALRACERFAENLKKVAEVLNKKQNDEEWIEEVETTCYKSVNFHQVQESSWQQFSATMSNFVEALKQEAEALAIAEIKGNTEGQEFQSLIHRRETKTLHPELHKFKLEKHAKILAMGGAPAVGSGMVLPRLAGKGTILKATGSAAAREIYYSKVEEKDARYLADVMQFHATKTGDHKAAWQQEVQSKHIAHRDNGASTPSTALLMRTPVSGELSDRLAARAARLSETEDATYLSERVQQAGVNAIPTTPELAAALKRRQVELAQAATPAAAPSTPPPQWSNPSTPYGAELSSTLQRRAQHQAENTPASASSTSAPVNPLAGANDELTSLLARRQSALSQSDAASPGASERTPIPHNPAHPPRTPMSEVMNSELAEKLRRRQWRDGSEGGH